MCYKGKCFYCIPVDTGCLILAILSAVVSGVIFLGGIIVGLLCLTELLIASRETHNNHELGFQIIAAIGLAAMTAAVIIFFVFLTVGSLISFIFSAILCNGICKRRPGQVKAYFIYGVVTTVLVAIASVVTIIADVEGVGLLGLLGCVIYSLFLVLVHHTHVKLVEDNAINDHMLLVEGKH